MLKADIHRINDKQMQCNVQLKGTISDTINEVAVLVGNVRKSMVEHGIEAELAFATAVSAALMGKPVGELVKELGEMKEE